MSVVGFRHDVSHGPQPGTAQGNDDASRLQWRSTYTGKSVAGPPGHTWRHAYDGLSPHAPEALGGRSRWARLVSR